LYKNLIYLLTQSEVNVKVIEAGEIGGQAGGRGLVLSS